MKRNMTTVLCALVLASFAAVAAHAQTNNNLGDYARQVRKQKAQSTPATKKFDNDNLPATEKLSVVGETSASAADANTDKTDTQPDAKAADGAAKPDQSAAGQASAAQSPSLRKTRRPRSKKATRNGKRRFRLRRDKRMLPRTNWTC
jgi:hypothetical protein